MIVFKEGIGFMKYIDERVEKNGSYFIIIF